MEVQHRSSSLKNVWDMWEGDLFNNLRVYAEGQGTLGDFKNKRVGGYHFHSHPLPRYTETCEK